MRRQFPGGRGPRFGPDANIANRESLDERTTRLAPLSGWYLAPMGDGASGTTTPISAANRLLVYPTAPISEVVAIKQARVRVAFGVAAQILRAAIYELQGQDTLVQVHGTECTLSLASAGIVSADLDATVHLTPGKIYLIGAAQSSVTALVASVLTTTFKGLYKDVDAVATNRFPVRLQVGDCTAVEAAAVPKVTYLSQRMAEVF